MSTAALLPVHPEHPEPRKIQRAVSVIQDGGLVAYPTDVAYGFGCDPTNKGAVDRLHKAKGDSRRDQLFTLLCPDLSQIARYANVDNVTYRLIRRLLPGPYTFILGATREVPKMLLTKQRTVGIRVPGHPVTQALLAAWDKPLLSTTAARPGEEPLIDPTEIRDTFAALGLVLDAGAGSIAVTTVVDLSQGAIDIVREGAGAVGPLLGSG